MTNDKTVLYVWGERGNVVRDIERGNGVCVCVCVLGGDEAKED